MTLTFVAFTAKATRFVVHSTCTEFKSTVPTLSIAFPILKMPDLKVFVYSCIHLVLLTINSFDNSL